MPSIAYMLKVAELIRLTLKDWGTPPGTPTVEAQLLNPSGAGLVAFGFDPTTPGPWFELELADALDRDRCLYSFGVSHTLPITDPALGSILIPMVPIPFLSHVSGTRKRFSLTYIPGPGPIPPPVPDVTFDFSIMLYEAQA